MLDEKLREELERLSVTLGAIFDIIDMSEGEGERQQDDNVVRLDRVGDDSGLARRLGRINKELLAQLNGMKKAKG